MPSEQQASAHQISLDERGSFCFASCTCGWFAPGRRSRDRARRDAAEHLDALALSGGADTRAIG